MTNLPLEGRRIVLTRQADKAREAIAFVQSQGGHAIVLPTIEIDRSGVFPEFEAALQEIATYDYLVVTSANTAKILVEELSGRGLPLHGRWTTVAIGAATARILGEGGVAVGAMPDEAVSDRIAACLGDVSGKRFLIPGSDLVRGAAAAELRSLGAHVDEVVAYRTVAAASNPAALAELERGFDALIFSSPSTVRNFDDMTKGRYREGRAAVACIGPVTAAEAMALGYGVDVVPADHSMTGLFESLSEYWRDAGRAAKGAIA